MRVTAVGQYYFVRQARTADRFHDMLARFINVVNNVSALPPKERYLAMADVELAKFPIECAILVGRCPHLREQFVEANTRLRTLVDEAHIRKERNRE